MAAGHCGFDGILFIAEDVSGTRSLLFFVWLATVAAVDKCIIAHGLFILTPFKPEADRLIGSITR